MRNALGEPVAVLAVESGGITEEVSAVFTRKDHVFVTAGDETARLRYKGKFWSISAHLWAERGWEEDPASTPGKAKVHDLAGRDAAPTYRAAIVAAVTSAVAAFAAKHPEVLLHAEVNRMERKAADATKKMNDLRKLYDDSVIHRSKVLTLLQEARNHLAEQANGR